MPNPIRQDKIEAMLKDLGATERQARVGAAIALCEAPWGADQDGTPRSNFDAVGDQELADETWGNSYGGFQIRSLREDKGTGRIRDEEKLLRPKFNCRSALVIRDQWGNWKAWSTFTSGQYKAYLQDIFPPPPNTYVVLAGDTLTGVTDRLSGGAWTWQDLAAVNSLSPPYTIYVGQHLELPYV